MSTHSSRKSLERQQSDVESQAYSVRTDAYSAQERKSGLVRSLMAGCLAVLLIFCIIGMITSGLVFGHIVGMHGGVCLSQSFILFSVCRPVLLPLISLTALQDD